MCLICSMGGEQVSFRLLLPPKPNSLTMRPKFHALTVSDIRRETKDCVSVAFAIPQDLETVYKFQQGQYLTLRTTIAGEDVRRSYSICSGIADGELRVAIKQVEKGVFSTWAVSNLKVGDTLDVMTPMGTFTSALDASQKKHYMLVAAGSGITPVLSIARSVLMTEPKSEVTLIYGNRHFQTIIFRDLLEDMKDRFLGRFRVFHVLSQEPNDVDLFSGRIDEEKLRGFCKTLINVKSINEVFVCGPEPMIRAVKDYMVAEGVPADNVHFELFVSPTQVQYKPHEAEAKPKVDSSKKCAVTVMFDGQESRFFMPMDGTRILDAAQQSGMDIPFSCKGGMCCTCRAHLSDGKADMVVNYALEPGEVEAGYVLTCQAVPLTESVTVDFDRH